MTLLRRTSRVVELTAAGRVFADEARRVIAGFDAAVADARRVGGASTTLRIGCVSDVPIEDLVRFLDLLRERLPGQPAHVMHLSRPEQLQRLHGGELELGIFHRTGDDAELEAEPILPGHGLAAYLAAAHPLAGRKSVTQADLAGEYVVTYPRPADPAFFDQLIGRIRAAGYRPRGYREAGGPDPRDVVLAVATEGVVGLLPALPEARFLEPLVVQRPLDPPVSLPELVVAWRRHPPPRAAAALESARDAARTLRAGAGGASIGAAA